MSSERDPNRQKRHQPPTPLHQPRELVIVVPEVQSNVNLSRIVRAAGCFGVRQIIALGQAKVDHKITRDAVNYVELRSHRSLTPVIRKYREAGFRIVALEQATRSISLYDYQFARRTLLVLGHERQGLSERDLAMVDDVAEIPNYGKPDSLNLATSAAIAIYEYCKQFPAG